MFASTANEFLCSKGNLSSVHAEIQNPRQRKSIQGFAVQEFVFGDLFSQCFGRSLDLLGIDWHAGQLAQQRTALLEADHGPYGAGHAREGRRE